MQWEGQKIRRIDEPVDTGEVGLLFGNDSDRRMQEHFNAFLADRKQYDTLVGLNEKWFISEEPM